MAIGHDEKTTASHVSIRDDPVTAPAGQWRQGLSSMSFPRWPKVTGGLGASKKVKPVPAVDPADSNIEMADFQGMPRCYESGRRSLLHAICSTVIR